MRWTGLWWVFGRSELEMTELGCELKGPRPPRCFNVSAELRRDLWVRDSRAASAGKAQPDLR